MANLHALGVLHRDLRPKNILFKKLSPQHPNRDQVPSSPLHTRGHKEAASSALSPPRPNDEQEGALVEDPQAAFLIKVADLGMARARRSSSRPQLATSTPSKESAQATPLTALSNESRIANIPSSHSSSVSATTVTPISPSLPVLSAHSSTIAADYSSSATNGLQIPSTISPSASVNVRERSKVLLSQRHRHRRQPSSHLRERFTKRNPFNLSLLEVTTNRYARRLN